MRSVWPLDEGVLLERKIETVDGLAVLFSLAHPLDDLCPVTCRRMSPVNNNSMFVVCVYNLCVCAVCVCTVCVYCVCVCTVCVYCVCVLCVCTVCCVLCAVLCVCVTRYSTCMDRLNYKISFFICILWELL